MIKMFRVLLIVTVSCFAFNLLAQTYKFMPDNDLWKDDDLYKRGPVTEELFNRIISAADSIYQPMAAAKGETLVINRKWTDATVNANCSRMFGSVTVNMFGGLARRDEITPEGFALVLCHELGHAYGGYPFISAWREMSAEGQADYYGAKNCHAQVMKILKFGDTFDADVSPFMEQTCDQYYGTSPEKREYCIRGLIAGNSLGNLLSVLKKETLPSYETPDKKVVDKTELSYPSTVQCRVDTYLNGVIGKDRPVCWFKN